MADSDAVIAAQKINQEAMNDMAIQESNNAVQQMRIKMLEFEMARGAENVNTLGQIK